MADSAVIRLEDVSKTYRTSDGAAVEVLRHVCLEVAAGEKASLIGPSGSGKSTLLSLIAGLVRPDTGKVVVDGTAIDDLGDGERAHLRAARVGIALQSDNLIPFLSARENIEQAIGFAGRLNRRAARQHADALLARFGVAHRADHRPRHLSGGEAQRVALAVAMANEPALLLADEVVAQLDDQTAGQVLKEVLAGDFALLYVTHDIALADRAPTRYRLGDHRIEPR